MALTRDEILARKMGRDVVEIDEAGGTVEVRGLNRAESVHCAEIDDATDRDIYIVSSGMVDPVMSTEDVKLWGEQDGGGPGSALEKVSRRIGELSGMVEGAGKSGVSRARRQRRS